LFSGGQESDTPYYVINREEYIRSLLSNSSNSNPIPVVSDKKDVKSTRPRHTTISQLKLLALPDQLKALMQNGTY
jgi:hypothetical protein